MSNWIELLILELTILGYYYYLINWFLKHSLPNFICYFIFYLLLLDAMVITACFLENNLLVLMLAIYNLVLVSLLYLVINDSLKKIKNFFSLVICILVFSYLSLLGKLEIYSISLAFFSLLWYNKLGNYFFGILILRVFDSAQKENNYFEKTSSYLANFLYFVIKCFTLVVIWEAKLLNRVFKRILLASIICFFLYALCFNKSNSFFPRAKSYIFL